MLTVRVVFCNGCPCALIRLQQDGTPLRVRSVEIFTAKSTKRAVHEWSGGKHESCEVRSGPSDAPGRPRRKSATRRTRKRAERNNGGASGHVADTETCQGFVDGQHQSGSDRVLQWLETSESAHLSTVLLIQRCSRGLLGRMEYRKMRLCCGLGIPLKSSSRNVDGLQMKSFRTQCYNVWSGVELTSSELENLVSLQARCRGHLVRLHLHFVRTAVVRLQCAMRGWLGRCLAAVATVERDRKMVAIAVGVGVIVDALTTATILASISELSKIESTVAEEQEKAGALALADQICWVTASPLHRAADRGDLKTVTALIALAIEDQENEAGGECFHESSLTKLLSAVDKTGASPLHWAGSPAVLNTLISAGAKVDAKDSNGLTPLHYFAAGPEAGILVTTLLETSDGTDVVNASDQDGRTALSHAAAAGNIVAVEVLLRAGADPNKVDANGWHPLVHAAARGFSEVALALLDCGATTQPSCEKIRRSMSGGLTTGLSGGGNAAIAAKAHGHLELGALLSILQRQPCRLNARTAWAAIARLGLKAVQDYGEQIVWDFVLAQRHAFCSALFHRQVARPHSLESTCCYASTLDVCLMRCILANV